MEKKKEPYSRPLLEIVKLDLPARVVATSQGEGVDQNNDNLNYWS